MKYGNDLGNGLGAEMQAYLDKTLLMNISENTVFDKYATMQKGLPLKSSKEIRFDKWIRMTDLYLMNNVNQKVTGNDIALGQETLQNVPADEYKNFALAEGSSGSSKSKMELIKQTGTVFVIGDWMPHTEEMELFHNRWSVAETAKQMGELAGLIVDGYYRDLYINGAGHLKTVATAKTVADPEYTTAVRQSVVALRLSGAKYVNSIMTSNPNYGTQPIRSRYIQIIHTIGAEAMKLNPDFVPVEKYRTGNELEGEEGTIGETIIISNPNAYMTEVSAGVYECKSIIFGKDHTAHIPLRGKNSTEFIYQPIGSGGSSDALKRVGTTGWKSWLGAKVLYPERLAVITVRANF